MLRWSWSWSLALPVPCVVPRDEREMPEHMACGLPSSGRLVASAWQLFSFLFFRLARPTFRSNYIRYIFSRRQLEATVVVRL
ncbi:hypothetical protein HDK90DRAFT_488291 [Phyllosticta capitalensis]|uniref:Secreted protein n=1 Tax=Phyllosticta capitalensis TaxID=121624 RepID=A0ABR1YNB1_9PEZI